MNKKIKVVIVGVGNCASALIQGIEHYNVKNDINNIGLMHHTIGGYTAGDIEIVAAYDIDERKVGRDVADAIFMPPNCTKIFCPIIPQTGIIVKMGKLLDGVAPHMLKHDISRRFNAANHTEPTVEDVVEHLVRAKADLLINYLPVGSQEATFFYSRCALAAGIGMINCIPVFIASDPIWVKQFEEKNLPIIGDDVKSQVGATIIHRVLCDLFKKRGVNITRTYQLNTGGNTDFLNMLDRDRLVFKKISKTKAVQAALAKPLEDDNIHVGPSDYVPWQKDNKIGFVRIEGELFGGVPMHLEMRLSVEDSPNSAGIVIDMIRCAKLAMNRKQGGVLYSPAAYFCKHPPHQLSEDIAWQELQQFIEAAPSAARSIPA